MPRQFEQSIQILNIEYLEYVVCNISFRLHGDPAKSFIARGTVFFSNLTIQSYAF